MTDERYTSPLGTRYASPDMQRLWGPRYRIGVWRRLWLALAEAQQELGLDIPDEALDAMRANLDSVDLDAAAQYEHRFRHDVMAHIHAFGTALTALLLLWPGRRLSARHRCRTATDRCHKHRLLPASRSCGRSTVPYRLRL